MTETKFALFCFIATINQSYEKLQFQILIKSLKNWDRAAGFVRHGWYRGDVRAIGHVNIFT